MASASFKSTGLKSEEESESVASSTSWWMLDEEAARRMKGSTPHPIVTFNKEQYECMVRVLQQPRFSGIGCHWTLLQTPLTWEELVERKGHCFVLPLTYMWLGYLRMAMILDGVPESEKLYTTICNAVQSCSSFMPRTYGFRSSVKAALRSDRSSDLEHPLSFIIFRHNGEGVFEVSTRKNLQKLSYSRFSKKIVGKVTESDHLSSQDSFAIQMTSLQKEAERKSCITNPSTQPANLVRMTSSQDNYVPFLNSLTNVLNGCEDRSYRGRELEGIHSKGFHLELERSFASVLAQLEVQDLEIDQTRLEKILFLKESHVYQLNPVISQDIGESLEKFVKERGEELLF